MMIKFCVQRHGRIRGFSVAQQAELSSVVFFRLVNVKKEKKVGEEMTVYS